jgi:hypothetical protein
MEYINYNDGIVEIRASIREDVDYLKDNLRDEDLEEMRLMGVETIENSLLFGFESPESHCYTVIHKGNIAAMFGVVPAGDGSATLWMLSTSEVKKFKHKFMKLTKKYVNYFKAEYETLFNLIHPSNTMSMKLVEILKAEFRWGYNSPATGEPFILFLI